MDTISPLGSFRQRHQLSKEHLLSTLLNRRDEPISDRTLRGLLSMQMRPCETKIQQNAENLASLVVKLNPQKNLQQVLQESLEALWAYHKPKEESNESQSLNHKSHELSQWEDARTQPRDDDPRCLSEGRRLADELIKLWTEYRYALYPEKTTPVYTPAQMKPENFLKWANEHGGDLLDSYEAERNVYGGKNLLYYLLSWTEAASSKLYDRLNSLIKCEKRWRTALKTASRILSPLAGKRERRMWLEYHRLSGIVSLSENWLRGHEQKIESIKALLAQAEEDSQLWIELFEEVDGERRCSVFDRLWQSAEIRMAIHLRWAKVVADGQRWPKTYDPLLGFVICDSPLWPKLDHEPDALPFGLAEAIDILLMPDELKRQLFYVPDPPSSESPFESEDEDS